MSSPLDRGDRWAALGVALAGLGLLSLLAEQAPAAVLVNESRSLPPGLYGRTLQSRPEIGLVVAVPAPASAKAYLRSLGASEQALLIKRVAAGPGDRVCRSGSDVQTPLRRVQARLQDRRGTPLPRWAGCRTLAKDEMFLLGDTPDSFDSRYFGPVPVATVTGVYQELATW